MLESIYVDAEEKTIIVTYKAPFRPEADIVAAQEQIAHILSQHQGRFFRIDDLSEAEMDWNAFVIGIDVATRNIAGSMTDSRIQGILVGEYDMVQMASQSMSQDQYGATDTPMFTTVEEARNYIRQASK